MIIITPIMTIMLSSKHDKDYNHYDNYNNKVFVVVIVVEVVVVVVKKKAFDCNKFVLLYWNGMRLK